MEYCFKRKVSETLNFGMVVFSHIFFLTMAIHYSHFWETYGFLFHQNYLRKPLLWNVCFFVYFFRIMEIHFPNAMGIARIYASSKMFRKCINLKCMCFLILFLFYGNSLFPCVVNCMDFWFKQKIPETLNFEMFVLCHIFSLMWEFTFLIFWELHVLMPHMKYVRNP